MADKPVHFEHGVPCPTCSETLDAADDVEQDGARPVRGNLSVCAYCSTILVYDDPPALHRATDDELAALNEDERDLLFASLEATRRYQAALRARAADQRN